MTEQAIITVDIKKHRIRLYKSFLHKLGDPHSVQLLVNPEKKLVAVRALEYELSGDHGHKINKSTMESDNSVEIYSSIFVESLLNIIRKVNDDTGYYYKIFGNIVEKERMGIFSLDNIEIQDENEAV